MLLAIPDSNPKSKVIGVLFQPLIKELGNDIHDFFLVPIDTAVGSAINQVAF